MTDSQSTDQTADTSSATPKQQDLTVRELVAEYKEISAFLNERWPMENSDQRVFARTMKMVEELGELADEILTSMNLQRNSKIAAFSRTNVEDEFADVLASLILLANELDIDVEEVIQRKIKFTRKRFEMDKTREE
jgi:NTP pyrophosphatase (non-canonical NTP hydrolase)